MAIEVYFRGPMLFVYSGRANPKTLSRIVIPDGTRVIDDDQRHEGNHADHTKAVPHYARILIVTPNGKPRYIDLTGKSVRFGQVMDRATMNDQKFDDFFPLNRIINRRKASSNEKARLIDRGDGRYATNVACEMFLGGGNLSCGGHSDLNYYFDQVFSSDLPDVGPLPLYLQWTAPEPELRIVLTYVDGFSEPPAKTIGEETITVEDRSKVYVFNFDQMRPDEKAVLSHDSQCDQRGKPIEDNDFKWLYQLIAPPNQLSLADWLATSPFPNKRLPAPLSQCPGPDEVRTRSPDTSTCFFRTWDEDL